MERKAISATDGFTEDGGFFRSLTFQTEAGTIEVKNFPDNCMSIIYGPREVYDWYGRRVSLGLDISYVVRHNGYWLDSKKNQPYYDAYFNILNKICECFVVRKRSGKYSIAKLIKVPSEKIKCTMPANKIILTGGYVGSFSVLECFGKESKEDNF